MEPMLILSVKNQKDRVVCKDENLDAGLGAATV